ncbi:protein THEM6-like [Ornithodoros turicata]
MGLYLVAVLFALLCLYFFLDVNYFLRHVTLMLLYHLRWKRRRLPLDAPDSSRGMCRLTDLDHMCHMNNARYLRAFEYGRTCFGLKNGLWKAAANLKKTLLVAAVAVRYRKPLKLFQKYHIVTKLVHCQGRDLYVDQQLITDSDNFVRATCLAKMTLTSGSVEELLAALKENPSKFTDAPAEVKQFVDYNTMNSERLNPNKVK